MLNRICLRVSRGIVVCGLLCTCAQGCSRAGFDLARDGGAREAGAEDSGGRTETWIALEIEVGPRYPTHGRDWNDYVAGAGATATDAACSDSATDCVHGGERRRAVLPGVASCAGLVARDALAAFDWVCREEAGQATFVSRGFVPGRGLADLVGPSSWRENSLEVRRDQQLIARSASRRWWSNPVRPLPASPSVYTVSAASGHVPGEVLTIEKQRSSAGINLDLDRIALVVLRDAALVHSGNVKSCSQSGETASTGDTCLLAAGTQRFLWIEGEVASASAGRGVLWVGVKRSRLHRLSVKGGWRAIHLDQSDRNLLHEVRVSNAETDGILLEHSSYNRLVHLRAAHNRKSGLTLSSASHNIVTDVTVAGSYGQAGDPAWSGRGIALYTSTDNTLSNLRVFSGESLGLLEQNENYRNTFSHLTAIGTRGGMAFQGPTETTVVGLLVVNSLALGVSTSGKNVGYLFHDLCSAHNAKAGISLSNAENHTFAGALYVGGNGESPCLSQNAVSKPGLIAKTCTDTGLEGSSSYQGQLSSAVLHLVDPTDSFVGPVEGDAVNAQGQSGQHLHDSITDWVGFENLYRAWGRQGGFPGIASGGPCRSEPQPSPPIDLLCQLWDWRIRAGDTALLNRNGAFLAGAACPASIRGDQVVVDRQNAQNRFLAHALEVIDDEVGDDDGLCESNEACIYSPHAAGAYQGEGDYRTATCSFQGVPGGVEGVRMHGYPIAGASP